MVVKQITNSEAISPTGAANQAFVMENRLGWAVRVTVRLVEEGFVPSAKLQMDTSVYGWAVLKRCSTA